LRLRKSSFSRGFRVVVIGKRLATRLDRLIPGTMPNPKCGQSPRLYLEPRLLGMNSIRSTSPRIFGRNRQERHHPPMRFVARLCIFFVFCLAIGLACSEIPELLSFGDDTSNDFVLPSSCACELRIDRAAHKRSSCLRSGSITKAPFPVIWRRCFASSPARSTGAEILLFLSIQRN